MGFGREKGISFEAPKNQGVAIKKGAQKTSFPMLGSLHLSFAVSIPPPSCADHVANGRIWPDMGAVGLGVFGVSKEIPSSRAYCPG
jgi:hypothetical protein